MDNLKSSNALVNGAVTWAADRALNIDVAVAMPWTLDWSVDRAVDDAVNRDVWQTLLRVRRDDPDHPGLQDFLLGIRGT